MVVGRAGVVNGPLHIVFSFAVEDVCGLAVCPCLERTALGGEVNGGLFLDGEHVVLQLRAGGEAVTPVEVALAGLGVLEHIDVDCLPTLTRLGPVGIGDDGRSGLYEGPRGVVAHGYAYLLAVGLGVVGGEIEVVFVCAVSLFALYDARCPGVARGPRHLLGAHIEHHALVSPVLEVGGGEDGEVVTAPAGHAVGGGIDVVFLCLVGVKHLGVGVEAGQYGLTATAGGALGGFCRAAFQQARHLVGGGGGEGEQKEQGGKNGS